MCAATDGETEYEAAGITLAMLRYNQETLAQNLYLVPRLSHQLSESSYHFTPRLEIVPWDQARRYLADLVKPILLIGLAREEMLALWEWANLDPSTQAQIDDSLASQQRALEDRLESLGIHDGELVLVETGHESQRFTVAALRYWTRTYLVTIAWTLEPLANDPRAAFQMILQRTEVPDSM